MENVNLFIELALEVKRLGAELEKIKAHSQDYNQGSFKEWVNAQIEEKFKASFDNKIDQIETTLDELKSDWEWQTENIVEKAIENLDFDEILNNADVSEIVRKEIKSIFRDI